MMRFAANLTMLYTRLPFTERFAAARMDGFAAVEFLSPYEHSPRELSHLLHENGLTAVLFNQWAKLWDLETLAPKPGAPEPDEQTLAWRKRLTEQEGFYVLDPDARTLLE